MKLLLGGEKQFKIIKSVESLADGISESIESRKKLKRSKRERIYRESIKKRDIIIEKLNSDLNKYYEFYIKHTYKFGEEITPLTDKMADNYIECKKCGFRERF